MKVITESAEHHFLTTIDTIKEDVAGWLAMSFHMSQALSHADIIGDLSSIPFNLEKARQSSNQALEQLCVQVEPIKKGYIYQFADGDVVGLFYPTNEGEKLCFNTAFKTMADFVPKELCHMHVYAQQYKMFEKMADQKFITAKRFDAYRQMADEFKVKSIGIRREKRDYVRVLLIEDDRFTSAYVASALRRDYELESCETSEEGIAAYIEHAPDIVLLDIHLPGLGGHDALKALKAIDKGAYIIMLSVDTVKENIIQASYGGANGFLKKPFSKERLIEVIKASPYVSGGQKNGKENGLLS